ncbi:MAG TPA: TonB-dependent receptor [Chthoniobacterales bacterium]|nr:TonB-dependent receptor [Chthoniobacterales bacterium]
MKHKSCAAKQFRICILRLGALFVTIVGATAAEDTASYANVEEVVVTAESESDEVVQGPFLPAVQGTKINAGKKTSVIDLDEMPRITNNNYRQALAKTPGLFVSEETSPLVSIGYRGLNPDRVQFTQVLKDGIPIDADQFGYPEAYYTPPLDTVDRIEFVHGGAALLYGPQPGGSLNYITHRPRLDREFSFGTINTFGSDQFYSNFTYLDGTIDRIGYYGYYNHRQTDGFREANSDVELNAGSVKLVLDAATDSRWIFSLDAYVESHGEPGGLTFAPGPNAVNYNVNRDATSRFFDMFELERYFASLAWEKDFSDRTKLNVTGWGGYYRRFSSRQSGGGFGTVATGNTTTNQLQEFYTEGLEARLRHDYEWLGGTHTLAGGIQIYHTDSPRQDRIGQSRDDRGGELTADTDRSTFYAPLFVENRFQWGALSVTPGFRLENIWQGVQENFNRAKSGNGIPLGDEEIYDCVPLFGLGTEYEVSRKMFLYSNVSESYRPKIFTQAVPTGGTAVIPNDLEESKAWQYELGFRGNPNSWVSWDASGFALDFEDQIGTIALPGGRSTVANVGRAVHYGAEIFAEFDVLGYIDSQQQLPPLPDTSKAGIAPASSGLVDRFGSLKIHTALTLLHAEFVSGPQEGNTPRYAPDYTFRTGLVHSWRDRLKIAFLGTFVGESFADDGNSPERAVPAYAVWDLTAEVKVYRETASLIAGINNIFDEDYYARITDAGIDPAYGRNFYVGFSLRF